MVKSPVEKIKMLKKKWRKWEEKEETFLIHTAIKEDGYSVTFKSEDEKGTVMVSHIFITKDGAITHYDMKYRRGR